MGAEFVLQRVMNGACQWLAPHVSHNTFAPDVIVGNMESAYIFSNHILAFWHNLNVRSFVQCNPETKKVFIEQLLLYCIIVNVQLLHTRITIL